VTSIDYRTIAELDLLDEACHIRGVGNIVQSRPAVIQQVDKDGGEQLFRDQIRTMAQHQPQDFQGHPPVATNGAVVQA